MRLNKDGIVIVEGNFDAILDHFESFKIGLPDDWDNSARTDQVKIVTESDRSVFLEVEDGQIVMYGDD